MTIGIGITTYNRYPVFKKTYEQIRKLMPNGAKLFVVDDCSTFKVPEANLRFEKNRGIAAAKNACLAALDDCDYIFLFDDDTYPLVKDWHLPYIKSELDHAMMIFPHLADGTSTNNRIIKNKDGQIWYQNPCGNMLFVTKKCIETVGGMDEGYGQWGGEHQDISQRIFNNGLTPHPFIDIANSTRLFYSHDYHQTAERSVPKEVRKKCIKKVMPKLNAAFKSKEFIPYKQMKGRVITTLFTGVPDPQRGTKWEYDRSLIQPLVNSVINLEEDPIPMTFLSDCIPEQRGIIDVVSVECTMNPYLQRWVSILEYLKEVKEDYVFCVDATDVLMLNNPFKENLGNYLWVGDEPGTLNNEWLIKYHSQTLFHNFFKTHANKPLLNAGLLGGRKQVVQSFLERMVWYIQNNEIIFSDMALFNYILYTEFADKIRHGRKVNTIFKAYDTINKHGSWFSHK